MKSVIFSLLLIGSFATMAQSKKYVEAMEQNISLLGAANTTQEFQVAANNFERIGDAEKTQWLPYYYAGLALARCGWLDTKLDKESNSARIFQMCAKAEAIEKNAEIYAIRNMASTQLMMIDPQTRWATDGREASEDLEKGMKLDPNNPRLYYLQGMSVFNTPVAFGGGKDNAKPIFEKAVSLYATFTVKPLYPNWGQKQSEEMLAKCQ